MKMSKTEQVKNFLVKTKLDDFENVQSIINAFCEASGETITYSQFHQTYKQFIANPVAFKQAMEIAKTSSPAAIAEIDEEIKIVKMKDVELNPILFKALPTGKGIDRILSDVGGVLRGCVNLVVGDPGAGKSTITADILADLQLSNKKLKTLYIQGEQSMIDAGYYYNKTPRTGNVDNLFLSQYANPTKALEKTLAMGWDVVVIDSFNDVQSKIKAATDMSTGAVETYLINLMIRTAEGDNEKKLYTTFFCIQQVTKGGVFVGSNMIKHATTAMMEVRFDEENKDERYVEFTKNRRCGDCVYKRMYFTLDKENGQILYDLPRFEEEMDNKKMAANEEIRNAADQEGFQKVFFGAEKAGENLHIPS